MHLDTSSVTHHHTVSIPLYSVALCPTLVRPAVFYFTILYSILLHYFLSLLCLTIFQRWFYDLLLTRGRCIRDKLFCLMMQTGGSLYNTHLYACNILKNNWTSQCIHSSCCLSLSSLLRVERLKSQSLLMKEWGAITIAHFLCGMFMLKIRTGIMIGHVPVFDRRQVWG